MVTIGTFTKSGDDFTRSVKTLALKSTPKACWRRERTKGSRLRNFLWRHGIRCRLEGISGSDVIISRSSMPKQIYASLIAVESEEANSYSFIGRAAI
jgi:hypothetical protein